jgi:AraC-like DNA-binding protein
MGEFETPQLPDRVRIQRELADRISRALPCDGRLEVKPGIFFSRMATGGKPLHSVVAPSLCVIAQGSKLMQLGEEEFRYDPAHYLVSTMELPFVGWVEQASVEHPYLSIRLVLDPSLVTSVMVESGNVEPSARANPKAVDVAPLDNELLEAVLRLVRLTENDRDYPSLAPLVTREIVYRLLVGDQSKRLRHLAKLGGQAHRISEAIDAIRARFDKPLRVDDIASQLHMSTSGFHAHFKAVTAMSPLQFQKQLRLTEARRLMLTENYDAAQAGLRVGYDDPSQFSREYKRHFGAPPKTDAGRLRGLNQASAGT